MELPLNVKTVLPHRTPMLMVDDILQLTERFIETDFTIQNDNIFVEVGVLSEYGLIENAAQTCSGIIGKPYFDAYENDPNFTLHGYISKIHSTKIYELPPVGGKIHSKGEMTSNIQIDDFMNCKMMCHSYFNGKLLAVSSFNLIVQEDKLQ